MLKLLILGGTGEGRRLANAARALPGLEVISSLAGRTREPHLPEGAVRIGGFGGIPGLTSYLRRERIALVVDATHPFAETISRNVVAATAAAEVPLLRLAQPAWERTNEDLWTEVADTEAAVIALPSNIKAFLTIGRQELAAFAKRPDCTYLVRLVDPPETLPLDHCELIKARGPFAEADEEALLQEHRVDCLVSKNAGGTASFAKILAARRLALPVIMISRPSLPAAETVNTIEAVLAWLHRHSS
jgi:precorrin-6A/cobalt-precorrin-6A reductase